MNLSCLVSIAQPAVATLFPWEDIFLGTSWHHTELCTDTVTSLGTFADYVHCFITLEHLMLAPGNRTLHHVTTNWFPELDKKFILLKNSLHSHHISF